MRLLLLISCLVLAGCNMAMTNKEIIEETQYCRANGMHVARYVNFAGDTCRIECRPPQE